MRYALLIWEMMPEETRLYLIPEMEAEVYEDYLRQANGRFINADEMNDGMKFLNTALMESTEECEEGFEQWQGFFLPYRVESDEPIKQDIYAVYLSGFVL